MKELVAAEIAKRIKSHETIGIGTGSTVDLALAKIGERIAREGLVVFGVPTSLESAWKCEQIGVHVLDPVYRGELAWGFDGADEVDPALSLIKGKGGAMLKEKIVAAKCREFVVIVDDSKLVTTLGARTPIPLEVIPEARGIVERALAKMGASSVVHREGGGKKHGSVITEAGNIILDVTFSAIAPTLEPELKAIVGVVETGLFIGYATEAIVAGAEGVRVLRPVR